MQSVPVLFLKNTLFHSYRDPRLFSWRFPGLKQVSECQFMTRVGTKIGKDCETETRGAHSLGSIRLQERNSLSALPESCSSCTADTCVGRMGGAVTSGSLASLGLGVSPKFLHQSVGFQLLYPSSKVSLLKLKDTVDVCS